jgi:hypothetical protein
MQASIKVLIVMMAACLSLKAQQLMPKAGITFSKTNAEGQEIVEQKFKSGFLVGAAMEFPVKGAFSLQPELLFIQKGFRLKGEGSEQGITFKIDNRTTINYLEVPVLLKYYLNDSDTRFYVIAGPSIGIGIGGKVKTTVDADLLGAPLSVTVDGKIKFGDTPPGYDPLEDTDVYFDNRIDAGLLAGFGVTIKEMFLIELRYQHGLTNLSDADERSMYRVIQFSFGMPFTAIKSLVKN